MNRRKRIKGKFVWLNAVIGFVLVLFACSGVLAKTGNSLNEVPGNAVIAQVGKNKITISEFKEQLRFYGRSTSFQDRLKVLTPEGKKAILKSMIRDRLLYLAAGQTGTRLDKKTELRLEQLRKVLIVRKYVKDRLKSHPVTEREMRRYYERHKEEFKIPAEIKVRYIIVKTKKEAEKILKQLKNGSGFAELASKYNIDATKDRGGEIGWIRKGFMVKPFEDAAFKLKKDEISGIVKTRFGYYVIKVEDIKKAEQKRYKDAKTITERQITEERIKQIDRELKRKYGVKVYSHVLNEILRTGKK